MSKWTTLKEIVTSIGTTYVTKLEDEGWVEAQALVPKLDEWQKVELSTEYETINKNMLETAKGLARRYGMIVYVIMAEFSEGKKRGLLVAGYTPLERLHLLVPVRAAKDDDHQEKYLPVLEEAEFGVVEDHWLDPWYKHRVSWVN
jgi:hypothetical protein